ncbi:phosphatase [Actinoplanes sp. ATCC 53533]|uniref:PP2C family protein-serine/threonine phosphatase n=1 Tax=Actinoplanes sp. ATCC 53533 TaxID=1288362 RepID=UPI000F772249|nr:PP2C family protein-serine/threonine phosphatase [Actinoplanes sp. ATCC 53533]RSM70732.1 phosphatase [Actinoplanes sp. ATCC 53533]
MAIDGARGASAAGAAGPPAGTPADRGALVREVLAVIPAGCTWLLPVPEDGPVADFRIAAVSGNDGDVYGRGASRVGALLSELYPSMVGGPLWRLYQQVQATGEPGAAPRFWYREQQAGVVTEALFDVSAHPMWGGLLVCWQRLDEDQRRLARTELLGNLGWAEYDLRTGRSTWSPGMYRIFERDPARGPLSRREQAAILLPADAGLSEAAWQTLDSGATSDVTVRFQPGEKVKYLRVLSDAARDADGTPLKICAVVQDVTARVDSRSEIERLGDQLRSREITALAEHRLAGQLQNLIQPVPREPFPLPGLQAAVSYLPAEKALQVGGDWYHAQPLPDGHTLLAVGDVAGHGLEAASGMAHLRFALVAWLSIGICDPGVLLGHLNKLSRQLAITGTAVIATYDPASGVLSWARGGHMAPLLTHAGRTEELPLPPGVLLGAADHARYPVVSVALQPGDLVLFYTDGLVERRDPAGADLLEQVKRTLSEVSAESGELTLKRLRDLLPAAGPDDDTCTLAVRVLR